MGLCGGGGGWVTRVSSPRPPRRATTSTSVSVEVILGQAVISSVLVPCLRLKPPDPRGKLPNRHILPLSPPSSRRRLPSRHHRTSRRRAWSGHFAICCCCWLRLGAGGLAAAAAWQAAAEEELLHVAGSCLA